MKKTKARKPRFAAMPTDRLPNYYRVLSRSPEPVGEGEAGASDPVAWEGVEPSQRLPSREARQWLDEQIEDIEWIEAIEEVDAEDEEMDELLDFSDQVVPQLLPGAIVIGPHQG